MQRSMKTRNLKTVKAAMSCFLSASLVLYTPVMAFAEEYDLNTGSITVNSDADGNRTVSQDNGVQDHPENEETVITSNNTETSNTVTINSSGSGDNAAEVTLQNVNINISESHAAAVTVSGSGDVKIEINGTNTLQSGSEHAGLEKGNTGNLIIQDDNNAGPAAGSLTATSASFGAGIGGGSFTDGSNITIKGGTITASGGDYAAGIGGGSSRGGSNITIEGGTVTANGGAFGAGIGGGSSRGGSNITIEGGTVRATGGVGGAGIGGGNNGGGSDITIEGGAVTAIGGNSGAGIGGGSYFDGSNITIEGGTVRATGGAGGAGIGGGHCGDGSGITIEGGAVTAIGGNSGAGIGGGRNGSANSSDITISGSADVLVAGGAAFGGYGSGAAIGNGSRDNSQGTPVDPVTDGLYNTGSIIIYPGGTSAEDMAGTDPQVVIEGEVQDPDENQDPVNPDPVNPGPVNPSSNTANTIQNAENSTRTDVTTSTVAPAKEQGVITLGDLIAMLSQVDLSSEAGDLNFGTKTNMSGDVMDYLCKNAKITINCHFTHNGSEWTMIIPKIDTDSEEYKACMTKLAHEPGGTAGFIRISQLFASVGVQLAEGAK